MSETSRSNAAEIAGKAILTDESSEPNRALRLATIRANRGDKE